MNIDPFEDIEAADGKIEGWGGLTAPGGGGA